jgi:predicted nucleic acid-binding protein
VHSIAIESNTLTYFIEAISRAYDPQKDMSKELAKEKIAMVRIYLYTDATYHVLPTVINEYFYINDDHWRKEHEEVVSILCLDHWKFNVQQLEIRKDYLLKHHRKQSDCMILAEAEAANMDYLLTYDKTFINKLAANAERVKIIKPSDYFDGLRIKPGSPPVKSPKPPNTLSQKKWWRI